MLREFRQPGSCSEIRVGIEAIKSRDDLFRSLVVDQIDKLAENWVFIDLLRLLGGDVLARCAGMRG